METIRETRAAKGWRWSRQVMLWILVIAAIQIVIGLGTNTTGLAVKGLMGILLAMPLLGSIAFVIGWLAGGDRT